MNVRLNGNNLSAEKYITSLYQATAARRCRSPSIGVVV